MPAHKTSAWPLAWVYAGLIVYASLYPFAHWRDQGIATWLFLVAPLPRYWTGFDVVSNVLGYMPLGFLLVLGALRSGRPAHALGWAVLACALLSLLMESLQVYLPDRVPSNLDLFLNFLGSALGAVVAWFLERLGVLQRWSQFRRSWVVDDARGALVLLALWPLALLFPLVVPFGLGQILERLVPALNAVLPDAFLFGLPWREVAPQPLSLALEWSCEVLALMIPCLLGYCVIEHAVKRLWFLLWLLLIGVATTTLSAALSFGPVHAWNWLTESARAALVSAMVLALALSWLSRRASAVLILPTLGLYLGLINQAPIDPYFEQALFLWEQGRFIRFHGLAQWLGWLWPYAALVYVLGLLWRKESKN